MPLWKNNSAARDALAQAAAISRSQAVIEFRMVRHDHHRQPELPRRDGLPSRRKSRASIIRCSRRRSCAAARPTRRFGRASIAGEFQAAEYKLIGQGRPRGLVQASYNPILNDAGRPAKIIKFATDIIGKENPRHGGCRQDFRHRPRAGRDRIQSRRHHHHRNENFLTTVGLQLEEIQGKHHQMFVAPASAMAPPIGILAVLNRGEFQSAEYRALGKGGKEVMDSRSYNPILDEPASRSRW